MFFILLFFNRVINVWYLTVKVLINGTFTECTWNEWRPWLCVATRQASLPLPAVLAVSQWVHEIFLCGNCAVHFLIASHWVNQRLIKELRLYMFLSLLVSLYQSDRQREREGGGRLSRGTEFLFIFLQYGREGDKFSNCGALIIIEPFDGSCIKHSYSYFQLKSVKEIEKILFLIVYY